MPDSAVAAVTPLGREVAARIVELIRDGRFGPGDRLVERRLGEELSVSRSPVRGALRLLADEGVVEQRGDGAYVRAVPAQFSLDDGLPPLYERLASDRLDGALADRVTEAALLRRYGCGPAELRDTLRRAAGEGWLERLPGYGWRFLPMLTTLGGYEESYRFRLVIEPAAILEPGFVVDRPGLEARRVEQEELLAGRLRTISGDVLFDLNSRLHETIVACSQNSFFLDSLVRVNRLRRLIELRQRLAPDRAMVSCREHIELIDALLDDRIERAADLMRAHLASVIPEKVTDR